MNYETILAIFIGCGGAVFIGNAKITLIPEYAALL